MLSTTQNELGVAWANMIQRMFHIAKINGLGGLTAMGTAMLKALIDVGSKAETYRISI